MANRVRSAKGTIVDFDEIAIKQQIAAGQALKAAAAAKEATPAIEVKRPDNFIDKKTKRKVAQVIEAATEATSSVAAVTTTSDVLE